MGKSPKLLSILVHPSLMPWEEMEKLDEQGHTIHRMSLAGSKLLHLQDYDLIFGPNCWRMIEKHKKYLAPALKLARKIKYPPKPKAKRKKK